MTIVYQSPSPSYCLDIALTYLLKFVNLVGGFSTGIRLFDIVSQLFMRNKHTQKNRIGKLLKIAYGCIQGFRGLGRNCHDSTYYI
jgi:hypothetical protein